jgi:hypothetical protein
MECVDMCLLLCRTKNARTSLPLEYTIDVFNNHSALLLFFKLVLDNFDFDQVSKTLNYLETNIHVYLEKVKESILKPSY